MIRITDFEGIKKPVALVLWVAAVMQLVDALKRPARRKGRRGSGLTCYGCRYVIDPGQEYRAAPSDLREGLGLHEGCAHSLVAVARELDKSNGVQVTDHQLREAHITG